MADRKPDVVQISIDMEDTNISEDEIAEILEEAGIPVYGIAWKARWTSEDYDNGKPPYSWD